MESHKDPIRLLFLDDSPAEVKNLVATLRQDGLSCHYKQVDNKPDLLAALDQEDWDTILCDHELKNFSTLETMTEILAHNPRIPWVVVSKAADESTLIHMMKRGASDYVDKQNPSRLGPLLQREKKVLDLRIKQRHLEEELRKTKSELEALKSWAADLKVENSPATAIQGQTILFAEPDTSLRQIMTMLLNRAGYSVLPATNGDEAMDLLKLHSDHIDLVLTEIRLPNGSGLSLAQQSQKLNPKIQVIFQSQYSESEIFKDPQNRDKYLFIEKPFSKNTLLDLLRALFSEK